MLAMNTQRASINSNYHSPWTRENILGGIGLAAFELEIENVSDEDLIRQYSLVGQEPVYYQDQTDWDHTDFYYLNRYLNRLLSHALTKEDKMAELKAMDLTRMTEETKVILYVLILFKKMEFVFEWENFAALKGTNPLKKRLDLVENPTGVHALYTKYNIGW